MPSLLEFAAMKRLANVLTWTLIVSVLCCVGVGIAFFQDRNTLRSHESARPTTTNTTAYRMGGRTYYAPANRVRRRAVLRASFLMLLALILDVAIALVLVKVFNARLAQLKSIELQRSMEAGSDFTISDDSISWIIPMDAKLAELQSRRTWFPFLVTILIGWFIGDFLLHLGREAAHELTATQFALIMVAFYFFIALVILGWTSVVTLNDQGIIVQMAGKTGRRAICAYGSVLSCWIEPSRDMPSLPCFAFRAPRKLRREKTNHVQMPVDADAQSLIRFLASKGVICVDRR